MPSEMALILFVYIIGILLTYSGIVMLNDSVINRERYLIPLLWPGVIGCIIFAVGLSISLMILSIICTIIVLFITLIFAFIHKIIND